MSTTLLNALQNPALYDHPVSGFTVMETHISWVLLTGDYVYKIKKPVNFGFLDYSSLDARKHFCAEELRLNRRLAPDMYLDLIPVYGSAEQPKLAGDGEIIEYMVKTRQFRQQDLLGNLQSSGKLNAGHIDAVAERLASFHQQIERAGPDSDWGKPAALHLPVAENFTHIRSLIDDPAALRQLERLEQWAHESHQRLLPQLAQRKAEGFVRECHGDIYLDNVTLVDGQVTLFDCIEFNESFRWTDVMSDVAFFAMDLEDRGLDALANRFVNAYLEHTGDYAGLHVLGYYKAFRAMVRAKVALLRLTQEGISAEEREQVMQRYQSYTALAERYTRIPARIGLLTHGVSGSGKSTLSLALVERLGAIRLRSDIERKRLFGNQGAGQMDSGLYSPERNQRTYQRLASLAEQVLAAGYPLVVDATHLKQVQREQICQAVEAQSAACLILHCQAPLETIASWLTQRRSENRDPSDADLSVVQHQLDTLEPLTETELRHCLPVATAETGAIDACVAAIRQKVH